MPRYRARLVRETSGGWVASAVEFPNTWSHGTTRESAVAKLRDEIRYRLELCPCSAVADDFVEIEVVSEPGAPALRSPEPAPAPAPAAPNPVSGWQGARPATAAAWRGVAGCPAPSQSLADDARPARPRRPSRWAD